VGDPASVQFEIFFSEGSIFASLVTKEGTTQQEIPDAKIEPGRWAASQDEMKISPVPL